MTTQDICYSRRAFSVKLILLLVGYLGMLIPKLLGFLMSRLLSLIPLALGREPVSLPIIISLALTALYPANYVT